MVFCFKWINKSVLTILLFAQVQLALPGVSIAAANGYQSIPLAIQVDDHGSIDFSVESDDLVDWRQRVGRVAGLSLVFFGVLTAVSGMYYSAGLAEYNIAVIQKAVNDSASLRDHCRTDSNWQELCAQVDSQACANQDRIEIQGRPSPTYGGKEEWVEWKIGKCGQWNGLEHNIDQVVVFPYQDGSYGTSRLRVSTGDRKGLMEICPNFAEYTRFAESSSISDCTAALESKSPLVKFMAVGGAMALVGGFIANEFDLD